LINKFYGSSFEGHAICKVHSLGRGRISFAGPDRAGLGRDPMDLGAGSDHEIWRRMMDEMRVARGLGWFSIGLGFAEAAAGHALGRWLGMEDRTWLIRAF
jgi:hypothetical protein